MRRKITLIAVLAAVAFFTACGKGENKPVELFNGKDLTGWDAWLSDPSLDPAQEFTVKDGVIHLSGKFGYIQTKDIYSDYTLEFEWRWVDTASNSGVFVYVQSPFKEWPVCYECQLMAGNAGDIINMPGASSAEYRANPESIIVKKYNPSNEKPVGEWNQGQIVADGHTMTVFINGVLQNKITETTYTSGHIALQSEGKAVEFRNVRLTQLKK